MHRRDWSLLAIGPQLKLGSEEDPTSTIDAEAPEEASVAEAMVAAAPAEPEAPVAAAARPYIPGVTTADGIPLEQILHDRPDVYAAFFREFHGEGNDPHSSAWFNRVGGATPQAYANYWYETYGKFGEYSWTPPQGAPAEDAALVHTGRLTSDGLSIDQLLRDRPDVAQAYWEAYLGPNNDPHSSAWMNRVGGSTVEDYANYWYETYGKHGEYGPSVAAAQHAAAVGVTITDEGISLQEILADRPDVFRAFFSEYYGDHNDRHSSAWLNRVGGETPEAYANYWYKTYGKAEGYVPTSLRPPPPQPAPQAPEDDGVVEGPQEPIVTPPGIDALGNPMPPPPEPPTDAPVEDVQPIFAPSGDDVGGLFLPRT